MTFTVFAGKAREMQPTLRIASASDASEIAALVNRAYRPSLHQRGWTHEADLVLGERTSPEQVLSLFGPHSSILVLCEQAAILACVHVEHSEAGAYIGMLATEPDYQSRGLGKNMLACAEQYAVEQFKAASFKMCVLSSRTELIAFYERRGYVRTGHVESYPVSAGVGRPLVTGLLVETLVKPADPARQPSFKAALSELSR